jgi:GNAT superfamily N-acetyltransferase
VNIFNDAFRSFPHLSLTTGEEDIYRRFRNREGTLVSCLDDSSAKRIFSDFEVLVFRSRGEPCGVVSLAVGTNYQKTDRHNQYGRIDLVIVDPEYRKLGISRVLVLAGVGWILEHFGRTLYSISCLAAHTAIARIFEANLAATVSERDGANFVHESLTIREETSSQFQTSVAQKPADAVQVTAYRLRQKENQ